MEKVFGILLIWAMCGVGAFAFSAAGIAMTRLCREMGDSIADQLADNRKLVSPEAHAALLAEISGPAFFYRVGRWIWLAIVPADLFMAILAVVGTVGIWRTV